MICDISHWLSRICGICHRSSVCSLEIMVMASGKQGNHGSGEGKLYAESNDVWCELKPTYLLKLFQSVASSVCMISKDAWFSRWTRSHKVASHAWDQFCLVWDPTKIEEVWYFYIHIAIKIFQVILYCTSCSSYVCHECELYLHVCQWLTWINTWCDPLSTLIGEAAEALKSLVEEYLNDDPAVRPTIATVCERIQVSKDV